MQTVVKLLICGIFAYAIIFYAFVVAVKAPFFIARIGNGRRCAVLGRRFGNYLRRYGQVDGKSVVYGKRIIVALYLFRQILAVFLIPSFKICKGETFVIRKVDVF